MPDESKKQFRAMQAAAHGKSNIGIPKKVGKEFTKATPKGAYKNLPEKKGTAKPKKKGRDFQFTK